MGPFEPRSAGRREGALRTAPTAQPISAPIAPERIETFRMVGERLALDHEDDLATLLLDPRVAETMWSPRETRTRADVRAGLERKLLHWHRHGFGQWFFRDGATGAMVGRGGPQHTMASGRDEVEIGWVITPERWREGLATELANASVEIAFGPLALSEVIAYTQPHNIASRRVMEKAGFVYERDITFAREPFVLYRRCRGRPWGSAHAHC
ncbi:MAG: GNAT family N-acetyltransferase [Solirubrobacterales bacterium]|nr:GNAT family N-acetyltransferase [Solirubrobacterales bacterium]MBV9535963.1 GNAT family N-acetyltransferase [Solirubrobacterales bacterium]